MKAAPTRILGLDPGLARVGYAFVDARGASLRKVSCGVISTSASLPVEKRLSDIYEAMREIISRYRPDEAAVEQFFFIKNPRTALQVGQARGVLLLALTQASLPIAEYAPQWIKQMLTDNRLATKAEVGAAVQSLLHLRKKLEPDDASDAAAIAICHYRHLQRERLDAATTSSAAGQKRRHSHPD